MIAVGNDPAEVSPVVNGSQRASKNNICFGGLDNGKLIPDDGLVENPFRQTTELGCTVDGGTPEHMPDLAPLVPDGKLA